MNRRELISGIVAAGAIAALPASAAIFNPTGAAEQWPDWALPEAGRQTVIGPWPRTIAEAMAYDHKAYMAKLGWEGSFAPWHDPKRGYYNGFLLFPELDIEG